MGRLQNARACALEVRDPSFHPVIQRIAPVGELVFASTHLVPSSNNFETVTLFTKSTTLGGKDEVPP